MGKQMWMTAGFGLSLLLLIRLVSLADAADEDVPKKMKDAINKMADAVAKGQMIDKEADQFFKDNPKDLKTAMWIFKLRDKDGTGGLGIGAKPGMYQPDGIEALIKNQTSRNPSMPIDLQKSADDLNRMLDINLAMAEITARYSTNRKLSAEEQMMWKSYLDEMKKAAKELKTAVKDNDKTKFKQLLQSLDGSCANCHLKFRN